MKLRDTGDEPQVAIAAAVDVGGGARLEGGPVDLDTVGERFEQRLIVTRSGFIELLHQTRQRARDRHPCGIRVRLAENRRELLVVVLQLEPPDHCFAVGRPQALEGGLVPFDPLAADRDVQRRSSGRRL